MQAPPVGGVPQGISRQAVENALQLVAERLKGTVAVTGDLATQGQGASIEALVSDQRDQARVEPVLRAIDPNAKVRVMPEPRWPANSVRVA
jgi:predicted LPLAT superfamily acyltransferase